MVEFTKFQIELTVCLIIIVAQTTQATWLPQSWFHDENRIEFDEKRSFENRQPIKYTVLVPDGCCPFVIENVTRRGGLSRTGVNLEIYQNEIKTQYFTEITCKEGVEGKPCGLIFNSKETYVCRQDHSYVKAIAKVAYSRIHQNYDFIDVKINSGCSCNIPT